MYSGVKSYAEIICEDDDIAFATSSQHVTQRAYCKFCGVVDEHYDEYDEAIHCGTIKHLCNTILAEYKQEKRKYSKNRENIYIFCSAESKSPNGEVITKIEKTDHYKVWIHAKSSEAVEFHFDISVDNEKQNILIVGVQLAHPQPQFMMNDHPYIFGNPPQICQKTSISISFKAEEIGQYEMPVMLTFRKKDTKKNIVFIRELVAMVEENPGVHAFVKSPYTDKLLTKPNFLIRSIIDEEEGNFKVPKLLKSILPFGLEDRVIDHYQSPEVRAKLRNTLVQIRAIFEENVTRDNYMNFFHHLLWWEEIIQRINLRKYNMQGVKIEKHNNFYKLEVPGLAEKRPSLIRGDRVFLQPQENRSYIFECVIRTMEVNHVLLCESDSKFDAFYHAEALFDVRFIMSRITIERAHEAISKIFTTKQDCRVFPVANKKQVTVQPITEFYNKLIISNDEQRSTVERIVSRTSGNAPYIVFGPPGTGKTMTIVEAIVQLVMHNKKNRIMTCTESNSAADHIAVMLLRFNETLRINNFILRANALSREWNIMPSELAPVSNGTNYDTFVPLSNAYLAAHRIVVTTLLHAAKYASQRSQAKYKLQMTHVFIDEAAQASEPNSLIPITGLLAPDGQLVLAGDPKQLGPVCMSREVARRGLGTSLLERLHKNYKHLYKNDPNYITMLVKNYRSHPDILKIPNALFYNNELQPSASLDPLSCTNILDRPGGEGAVVFYALNSKEARMGSAPSYFNEKELEMLKYFIEKLVDIHKVEPHTIGIIAPYIRQVYKMKAWLESQNYREIEVGTVESFQGKEKRVILVSTVRANCKLLDYDAKYGLGFLVDDKRFNVAITRAKAKLIIIGNPTCLVRDIKWRTYMNFCKELKTYYGYENQQLDRTANLLTEVARIRFDKCGLTEALQKKINKKK